MCLLNSTCSELIRKVLIMFIITDTKPLTNNVKEEKVAIMHFSETLNMVIWPQALGKTRRQQDHWHRTSFPSHSRQITKWRKGPRTIIQFQRHVQVTYFLLPGSIHLYSFHHFANQCPNLESMCSTLEASGQFHIQTKEKLSGSTQVFLI